MFRIEVYTDDEMLKGFPTYSEGDWVSKLYKQGIIMPDSIMYLRDGNIYRFEEVNARIEVWEE